MLLHFGMKYFLDDDVKSELFSQRGADWSLFLQLSMKHGTDFSDLQTKIVDSSYILEFFTSRNAPINTKKRLHFNILLTKICDIT